MSFSTIVKSELCRVEYEEDKSLLAELCAVLVINTKEFSIPKGKIKIITENAAFARNIFSSYKKLFGISLNISIRKSMRFKKHALFLLSGFIAEDEWKRFNEVFLICMQEIIPDNSIDIQEGILDDTYDIVENEISLCRRAFLRGTFLAAGSMSDPEKTYHLEINTHSIEAANRVSLIINDFNLNARISSRKSYFVVYLKEGENIVDFLNIIGAHSSLLELENVRILKEMRNNVNRIVNCETANLDKTVDAAMKQTENIVIIKNKMGLQNLPEPLSEIANLRLEYPDLNLKELGELMTPPLGKSGVNHRFRKLEEIAERLRDKKHS